VAQQHVGMTEPFDAMISADEVEGTVNRRISTSWQDETARARMNWTWLVLAVLTSVLLLVMAVTDAFGSTVWLGPVEVPPPVAVFTTVGTTVVGIVLAILGRRQIIFHALAVILLSAVVTVVLSSLPDAVSSSPSGNHPGWNALAFPIFVAVLSAGVVVFRHIRDLHTADGRGRRLPQGMWGTVMFGAIDKAARAQLAEAILGHLQASVPGSAPVALQFAMPDGGYLTASSPAAGQTDSREISPPKILFTTKNGVMVTRQTSFIRGLSWPKDRCVSGNWYAWPLTERERRQVLETIGYAVQVGWTSRDEDRRSGFSIVDLTPSLKNATVMNTKVG
jgi:hypothetical protein